MLLLHNRRALIYLGLAVICGVLTIAGVSTAIVVVSTSNIDTDITLWRACSKFSSGEFSSSSCTDVDDFSSGCSLDRIKTMRAFGIMSILVAFGVCIPLGVIDLFARDRLPPALAVNWRLIMAIAAFVLMVFEVIFWALFARMWNASCEDDNRAAFKDVPGSAWGAAAPLFIVAWILSICMMAVALLVNAAPVKEQPPVTENAAMNTIVTRPPGPTEPTAA